MHVSNVNGSIGVYKLKLYSSGQHQYNEKKCLSLIFRQKDLNPWYKLNKTEKIL